MSHFIQRFLKAIRFKTTGRIKPFEKTDMLQQEKNHLLEKTGVAPSLSKNRRGLFRRQAGQLLTQGVGQIRNWLQVDLGEVIVA